MSNKPNINLYWFVVREHFPDARFEFWCRAGELHFYPDGEAEARNGDVYACTRLGGEYVIFDAVGRALYRTGGQA